MLKMEDVMEFKMVKFVDDRRSCSECRYYSYKPWRGKCSAQLQQYNALNCCGKFTEKNQQEEKPFWL